MRLEIEVDERLAGALASEGERLGFDSRESYVRWLLRERGTLVEATDGVVGEAAGEAAAADGGVEVELSPGRVSRPDDGGIDAAATRLGDVERDRFEAMLGENPPVPVDDRPGASLTDLDALDLPGYDDDLLERRRRLVGAALELLKEHGTARRATFVDALREERPAGYDSVDGWWRCLKRGLGQVDRVRDADASQRVWCYRDVRGRVHVTRE
jgi:hypothetical protein